MWQEYEQAEGKTALKLVKPDPGEPCQPLPRFPLFLESGVENYERVLSCAILGLKEDLKRSFWLLHWEQMEAGQGQKQGGLFRGCYSNPTKAPP